MLLSLKSIKKLFFIVSFLVYAVLTYSQGNTRYRKETKLFLNAIRDSTLTNPVYGSYLRNDTLLIREFLWNYHVFGGMVLYGEISSNGLLNSNDKEELIKMIETDTVKYFIKDNFIKKSKAVKSSKSAISLSLSKPIFLKHYQLCVISLGSPDNNKTLLFKKGIEAEWIFVKKIGDMTTY
jgi:hypothetical protein